MPPTGGKIHGHADIHVADVSEVGLNFDPDNKPPRHANVTGWPEKSSHKFYAQKLAARAALTLA